MTLPLRLMTLHFSHMGFTEGLTFIVNYLQNVNALWPHTILVPYSRFIGARPSGYGLDGMVVYTYLDLQVIRPRVRS